MTLDALIMGAGAFIVLEPHLGFPDAWDNALLFLVGVFVIALGIVVRRRGARIAVSHQQPRAFAESRPVQPPVFKHEEAHE